MKYGPRPKSPAERFWQKVKTGGPDDCWEWTGAKTGGYGFLSGDRRDGGPRWIRAHRLSWEIANGPIPEGLSILHGCDNPPCCNPAHLYAGTQQQNVSDRAERGRGKEHRQFGSANDNAKLSEADVIAIKMLLDAGKSQTKIAALFGVGQAQISRIKLGQTWRHLEVDE